MSHPPRLGLLLPALALVVAACSSTGEDDEADASQPSAPATITTDDDDLARFEAALADLTPAWTCDDALPSDDSSRSRFVACTRPEDGPSGGQRAIRIRLDAAGHLERLTACPAATGVPEAIAASFYADLPDLPDLGDPRGLDPASLGGLPVTPCRSTYGEGLIVGNGAAVGYLAEIEDVEPAWRRGLTRLGLTCETTERLLCERRGGSTEVILDAVSGGIAATGGSLDRRVAALEEVLDAIGITAAADVMAGLCEAGEPCHYRVVDGFEIGAVHDGNVVRVTLREVAQV